MANPKFTREEAQNRIRYDPDTGSFVWIYREGKKWWNANLAGKSAGNPISNGYIRFNIFGGHVLAHRFAFFYMTGKWPKEHVDHINNDKSDNRWSNLRNATSSQNCINRVPRASKYAHGVRPNGSGFVAKIKIKGKYKYLGTYRTVAEAHEVYKAASIEIHGKFSPYYKFL